MIDTISVNGFVHNINYNALANKPDITGLTNRITALENGSSSISEDVLPSINSPDQGHVLIVTSDETWGVSDFSILDLCTTVLELRTTVSSLVTQVNQLQARVSALASGSSDTQANVTNETVSLSGSGVSVTGEKLIIDDPAAVITGEKMSIS